MKVMKAMLGRFEDSRIANCMPSKLQPRPVHSFRRDSIASSVTVPVSTTLYRTANTYPGNLAATSIAA